jgi:hypothetical protein
MPHVLGRDREGSASVIASADRQMDVRMGGVVVVDRHPFERRSEVRFHDREERSRVLAEIELLAFLGREDHLPEPSIAALLPVPKPVLDHDVVARTIEAEAPPALALRSLSAQVAAMRSPSAGRSAGHIPDLHEASLMMARASALQESRLPRGRRATTNLPRTRRRGAKSAPSLRGVVRPDASRTKANAELVVCQGDLAANAYEVSLPPGREARNPVPNTSR